MIGRIQGKILEKIPHKRTSDGELFLPSYMLN